MATSEAITSTRQPALAAGTLGLWGQLFQAVTHMAPAAGIVFSTQYMASQGGASHALAYVVATIACTLSALCLKELVKKVRSAGGYFVIHSPHWYYPTDGQWVVAPGAIGDYLRSIGFCGRKDPVDLEGFHGSRADYYEPFKKYLMDGHTCTTAPHKHFGCEANDVIKQLHMRKVGKVIMAGPVANICLESHMRDIIEAGIEVAMVRDAVAAAVNEEGNGYEAAMINWRFMANAVWTTEETIKRMKMAA